MQPAEDTFYLGKRYAEYVDAFEDFTRWLSSKLELASDDHLVVTCGATGALDAALSLFAPGQKIAMMPYEYHDMVKLASQRNLQILRSTEANGINDIDDFVRVLKEHQPDTCYLSLPNNPLGQEYSEESLKEVLHAMNGKHVIIDQTLVTASPLTPSWFSKHAAGAHVLLVGSFSKSHGLVAERIGYLVSLQNAIDVHRFAHAPSLQSMHAVRATDNEAFLPQLLNRIQENIGIINTWASTSTDYTWRESKSNFAALEVHNLAAADYAERLNKSGFHVKTSRELEQPGNFLRIDLTMPPTMTEQLLITLEGLSR